MTSGNDHGAFDPYEPGAAIHLGERASAEREATLWGVVLVVFMRSLAALWTLQGLLAWAGLLMPARSILETAPRPFAVLLVIFSVLDLVAAVGLWLATPWGGVLWLFAASVQIFAGLALHAMFWAGWIIVDVILIAIYFVLTWQAGRMSEQQLRHPARASKVKQNLKSNAFIRFKV